MRVGLNFENLAIPGLSDLVEIRQEGVWRVFEAIDTQDNALVSVWISENPTKRRHHERFEQALITLDHETISGLVHRPLSSERSASGITHVVFGPQPSQTLLDDIAANDAQMWTAHVDTIRSTARLLIPVHNQDIAHGHITPSTILVADGELPSLAQFGLAILDNYASFESTPSDQHVTVAFRAPECLTGSEVTPRSDVYGLGISLWTALNGYAPFYQPDGETKELLHRIQFEIPGTVTDRVPSDVRGVIERAMAKDPADRQADASEFMADLDAAVTASATLSNQPAFIPATYESGSQLRIGTISRVVVGAVLLLCVGGYAAFANPGDSSDVEPQIQILGTSTVKEPTSTAAPSTIAETSRPTTSTTPLTTSTSVPEAEVSSTVTTSAVTRTTRRPVTTLGQTTTSSTTSTTSTTVVSVTTTVATTTTSPSITIKPGPTVSTTVTTTPTTAATTSPTTTPTTLARITFTLPTFPPLPDFFGPRADR